jgi:hypothetical protein
MLQGQNIGEAFIGQMIEPSAVVFGQRTKSTSRVARTSDPPGW